MQNLFFVSIFICLYTHIKNKPTNVFFIKIKPLPFTPITPQVANRSIEVELFTSCFLGSCKELQDVVLRKEVINDGLRKLFK